MSLEILNLSLEKSPNSTQKKNLLNLSLQNSPNSALEFGEFSKLILVFEKKTCFRDFVFFNLSSGKSPNSRVEFGDFSKLRFKNSKLIFFGKKRNLKNTHTHSVWRILQTQGLSLEISPNSRVEFGDFSKLRFKISKLIFFGKKTKFKKYTHSEVEFGEFSKLKG